METVSLYDSMIEKEMIEIKQKMKYEDEDLEEGDKVIIWRETDPDR